MSAEENLIEGFLSAGNVSDVSVADELTENISGCYVLEDMGYDSDNHRKTLLSNNNVPVIPGRKNRKLPIIYDKTLYKMRSKIERFFGKLKENRRLAMRYEKSDSAFMSFIAIAAIKLFMNNTFVYSA